MSSENVGMPLRKSNKVSMWSQQRFQISTPLRELKPHKYFKTFELLGTVLSCWTEKKEDFNWYIYSEKETLVSDHIVPCMLVFIAVL